MRMRMYMCMCMCMRACTETCAHVHAGADRFSHRRDGGVNPRRTGWCQVQVKSKSRAQLDLKASQVQVKSATGRDWTGPDLNWHLSLNWHLNGTGLELAPERSWT